MPGNIVLGALKHVWSSLQALNVPTAFMGGIALSAWQHVRSTRDVNLLISIPGADLDSLVARLREAGLRSKREPPIISLEGLRIAQMLCESSEHFVDVQVDLLLAESEYQQQALARRVPISLPELNVDVLTVEDLVLHKLIAGRIIDRADAATLLRLNRAGLDRVYLLRWAQSLGVNTELAEIWTEAFPGESSRC